MICSFLSSYLLERGNHSTREWFPAHAMPPFRVRNICDQRPHAISKRRCLVPSVIGWNRCAASAEWSSPE